jgi:hypothetical protein
MVKKSPIYAIELTEECFENYGDDSTPADDMAEHLRIDSVMTGFAWDENEDRNLVLTAYVKEGIDIGEALAGLEDNEYIKKYYEM